MLQNVLHDSLRLRVRFNTVERHVVRQNLWYVGLQCSILGSRYYHRPTTLECGRGSAQIA